jgi:sec-independent protein translocase protein TatA
LERRQTPTGLKRPAVPVCLIPGTAGFLFRVKKNYYHEVHEAHEVKSLGFHKDHLQLSVLSDFCGESLRFFKIFEEKGLFMGRFEEILLVVFLILLLFGSTKLPELGKSIGKAIKEFKEAVGDDKKDDENKK